MLGEALKTFNAKCGGVLETGYVGIDEFRRLNMQVKTVVSVEQEKKPKDCTR